ncbi:methyltransferase domain-containing protein [Dyella sp. C11]|uniref:methyltransferase domain-containing protein n=1 Tax=Dyella sp. C11 TaxID=2126991 RepID=UPI0013008C85|nr:methyltransferase domain-containing protein [Dyella sp. C11]
MLETLNTIVCEVERDRTLERPEQLRERIRAMDRLEDVMQHEPSGITPAGLAVIATLRRRAKERHATLADVQQRLCDAIRHAIKLGAGAHALRGWVRHDDLLQPWGYDHLDALVGDVLALDEPVSDIAPLDTDMVFYQPTPVRHVLDLIERARLTSDDVLVDLGSGMGHVPLLVSICTDAQAIGIEREEAYVSSAQRAAAALRVERARFVAQDAREMDTSRGTLFYLYTPFTGDILRQVLDQLRREAGRRPFRIATLGPCTPTVANESWLRATREPQADRITLFRSIA